MISTRRFKREPPDEPSSRACRSPWQSLVPTAGLMTAALLVIGASQLVWAQERVAASGRSRAKLSAPQLDAASSSENSSKAFPVIMPGIIVRSETGVSTGLSDATNRVDDVAVPLIIQPLPTHEQQALEPGFDSVTGMPSTPDQRQTVVSYRHGAGLSGNPFLIRSTAMSDGAGTAPPHIPPIPVPLDDPETQGAQGETGGVPGPQQPVARQPVPARSVRISGGHSQVYPGRSHFRASSECDAQVWMQPYRHRAQQATSNAMDAHVEPSAAMDPRFSAWWDGPVRSSTGMAPNMLAVNLDSLVQKAMVFSPQVLAIRTEPHIQYYVVGQEEARFDWSAFLETTWDDLKDPVGNELALGIPGEDRLRDENFSTAFGMRRRNRHGGEFEMSQRAGHQRQNSRFFTPNPQGSSRLELRYRQPLMNGAGAVVNESQIVLARITANSSEDKVVGGLQEHLVQVTEAYWTLYRARAEFFQRQKLLQSSEAVLRQLEGRNEVDTIPRQILRARAAVARAQTGIQRTLSRVRDAEAQLRLLVNSPDLLNTGMVELTPQVCPTMITDTTAIRSSLNMALQNRPDISEAIRQMRSSGVRLGVGRNELLPRLDFIVSSYVSDITGSSLSDTLYGQFTDVRPSYTLGMEFEVPLGNRAARARLEQRKWELKRSISVFRATVEKALTDVEIAHREVATAWSEVLSRYHAMTAAQNEASYLQDRFDVLPMAEDSATLLLEDLLDAFERVADEESAFVQAQVAHAIAIIRLRQEMGVLLRSRESRPQLDSTQAQWLSQRLDSADSEEPQQAAAEPGQSQLTSSPSQEAAELR